MKTKLTLTVRKDIIAKAKRKAKERGVSVSRLFEEAFESDELQPKKSKKQHAIERLLKLLERAEPVETGTESDKELYRKHMEEKYG